MPEATIARQTTMPPMGIATRINPSSNKSHSRVRNFFLGNGGGFSMGQRSGLTSPSSATASVYATSAAVKAKAVVSVRAEAFLISPRRVLATEKVGGGGKDQGRSLC